MATTPTARTLPRPTPTTARQPRLPTPPAGPRRRIQLSERLLQIAAACAVDHALALIRRDPDVLRRPVPRLETLNRLRRAVRAWLVATLQNRTDAAFLRTLREDWMPRILAGGVPGLVQPAHVASFLEHAEGVLTALCLDGHAEDHRSARAAHEALAHSLRVQRAALCP